MTTSVTRQLVGAAVLAACVGAGCGLSKQDRPALSGPSEFGQSIAVAATPDHISQDGQAQTIAQATIRDANGKAMPGVTVHWSVIAWRDTNGNNIPDGSEQTFGALVEPSSQQSITDGAGIARISVAAPPPPVVLPTDYGKLRITVDTVDGDFDATLNQRSAVVVLVPPPGTLPQNRVPIASFTITPAIGIMNQSLFFDASTTTDEGDLCGDACTYQWDFGDFEHGSGKTVNHSYWRAATFTVTLTVTDGRGGVGSTSRNLTITGPAPPTVSAIVAVPSAPVAGSPVVLRATYTVGTGARVESFEWDFDDGSTATTEAQSVTHTFDNARAYNVRVKLTDNFGQSVVQTLSLIVAEP